MLAKPLDPPAILSVRCPTGIDRQWLKTCQRPFRKLGDFAKLASARCILLLRIRANITADSMEGCCIAYPTADLRIGPERLARSASVGTYHITWSGDGSCRGNWNHFQASYKVLRCLSKGISMPGHKHMLPCIRRKSSKAAWHWRE